MMSNNCFGSTWSMVCICGISLLLSLVLLFPFKYRYLDSVCSARLLLPMFGMTRVSIDLN